jgi:hypothetical protein
MLKTTRILLPFTLLSLTILSLAVIFNGGSLDLQLGPDNRFHIESIRPFYRKATP